VRTTAVLRQVSAGAEMTIVSFDVDCLADGRPILQTSTAFGFFPPKAFHDQVGLPPPVEAETGRAAGGADGTVDLRPNGFGGSGALPQRTVAAATRRRRTRPVRSRRQRHLTHRGGRGCGGCGRRVAAAPTGGSLATAHRAGRRPGDGAGVNRSDGARPPSRHRAVAQADEMAAQRDLPMGRHDPDKMTSSKAVAAFDHLVQVERELAALLRQRQVEHEQMLAAARGQGQAGGARPARRTSGWLGQATAARLARTAEPPGRTAAGGTPSGGSQGKDRGSA
jgi:hypothetical protein